MLEAIKCANNKDSDQPHRNAASDHGLCCLLLANTLTPLSELQTSYSLVRLRVRCGYFGSMMFAKSTVARYYVHVEGSMQNCGNSFTKYRELPQFCMEPSMCTDRSGQYFCPLFINFPILLDQIWYRNQVYQCHCTLFKM